MNPLDQASLPVALPNTKAKTLYLSSFLIYPKEPEVVQQHTIKISQSKLRTLKSNRKTSATRIPHKKLKLSSAVDENDENSNPPTENSDLKEVYLSYNDSNTPKYIGKFLNVMVGNRLKRQCRYCHLQYADLKGFNRHYEKKHGRQS